MKKILCTLLITILIFSMFNVISFAKIIGDGPLYFTVMEDETLEVERIWPGGSKVFIPETYEGKTVVSIGVGAFEYCELTEVSIPNTIIEIKDLAFKDNWLKEIIIPDSVKSIGYMAFANNYETTSIVLGNNLQKIEEEAFSNCIMNKNIELPESLTELGDYAFHNNNGLETVKINSNLFKLESGVFSDCKSLKNIDLGNIASIDSYAFVNCSSLEDINLPENLISIGDGAFRNSGLKLIEFNDNLEIISAEAFKYCKNLQSVSLAYVKHIADRAFKNCDSLTNIKIPMSVDYIGKEAFKGWDNLKSITFEGDDVFIRKNAIPKGVLIIGHDNSYAETYAKNNKFKFKKFDGIIKDYTKEIKLSTPSLSLKSNKKSVTLTFSDVLMATRYKIEMFENGKWKNIKKTSYDYHTVEKLKSNKKYKFRVRAFTKQNGNTIYSKYSKVKSIKIKK